MNNTNTADILLQSANIFTAAGSSLINGHVAIAGGKIISVGAGDGQEYIGENTKVMALGEQVVCPGFSDVHCFFTGYVLGFVGTDLSAVSDTGSIISAICDKPDQAVILGHGLNSNLIPADNQALSAAYPDKPVILFAEGGETCYMNDAAIKHYQFTPDTCYPEAYYRLLKDVLSDRAFIVPEFKKYMKMMNSKGVTAVKEMGFDDFYGFTDVLKDLEAANELTLRVNFMSQPVGAGANLEHGRKMREQFTGDFVHFSGYNRMTDGSISEHCGDLKQPYNDKPGVHCAQEIDYEMIKKETLAIDAEGFRFSLHAQGDAAISKVLDIYDCCQKNADGTLKNRHSITDLEFSDPADLERMGKMGVIAEIYPQIQSIANRTDKLAMIKEKIGEERGQYYWNRRKMADSGVLLSCGTDLPLLIDDIPESLYHACTMKFPEGGEAFNPQNALTVTEVLTAWTKGGAYNLYAEKDFGTLEVGKTADIAVLDTDVFTAPLDDIRDAGVSLTIVDGEVVYLK